MTSPLPSYDSRQVIQLPWIHAIETYQELPSTNTAARIRIAQGCSPGTVIRAVRQTAGRGRLGRRWFDHTGSLAFSILWPFRLALPEAISLILGAAAVDALQPWVPTIRVKWPNDLWIGQRKAAGMLGETFQERGERWLVFGMGLNVNGRYGDAEWSSVPDNHPISLAEVIGHDLDIHEILVTIVTRMDSFLTTYSEQSRHLQEDMEKYGNFLGEDVIVTTTSETFSGRAVGVSPDGSLRIQTASAIKTVWAGDVSLRPQTL